MPDLRGHHRLRARRERRVAHREPLVVGEVPGLLLGAEGLAAELHREYEVGLLDHLLSVEIEVGKVEEERVLIGPGVLEVPDLVVRVAVGLRVHAEARVERDEDVLRGRAPIGHVTRESRPAPRASSRCRTHVSAAPKRFRRAMRFV